MPRHEARIIYDSSISTLLNINFHKLKERRSERSLKYRLRVSMPCESDRDEKEDGMGIEINTTSGTVPDVAADFFPFNVILDGIKSFANWVTWREKFNFQLVAIVYKENKSSCFNFWDGFFFVVTQKGIKWFIYKESVEEVKRWQKSFLFENSKIKSSLLSQNLVDFDFVISFRDTFSRNN